MQSNPDAEWTDALPHLQATLNNSKNASTNVEPNAVVMGFKTNLDALDPLVNLPPADFAAVRAQLRTEAADALGWAAATMKQRYDTTRRPITLHPGDKVMLKLHKGYQIPGNLGPKLGKQRVGPFTIERMVGRLACRLKLPPTWRIHPVVSVAQLEPAPNDPDPHGRENPEPPPLSTDLDDPAPVYEIESLLARRRSRGKTQYLVKCRHHHGATWGGSGRSPKLPRPVRAPRRKSANPLGPFGAYAKCWYRYLKDTYPTYQPRRPRDRPRPTTRPTSPRRHGHVPPRPSRRAKLFDAR